MKTGPEILTALGNVCDALAHLEQAITADGPQRRDELVTLARLERRKVQKAIKP